MDTLPTAIGRVLRPFEAAFSDRGWAWAQSLLVGAILAPGQRTVTAVSRVLGRSTEAYSRDYQRVSNRARWPSRGLSRTPLRLLVRAFVAAGAPLVLGLGDTSERRRGARIAAEGIYRDPVRSSTGHSVKASGLRRLSLRLPVHVPWAGRVWALPFLTVSAPSERYHRERGQRHQQLTEWARQVIRQVRRRLPDRRLVVVADSTSATLDLLAAAAGLRPAVPVVTRWRLDAAL